MEKLKSKLLSKQYSKALRDVKVTYVYGDTGKGKTYDIMTKYGVYNMDKVYRAKFTNRYPWDNYDGQKTVIIDEFRSELCHISELLDILDIYPLKLHRRYSDTVACYNEIYIVTNRKLEEQYRNIQRDYPEDWKALLRRINYVKEYKNDTITEMTLAEYFQKQNRFVHINVEDTPYYYQQTL